MPSPIGHMLAGTAAGVFVAGRSGSGMFPLLVFAAAGAAPDIDLMIPFVVHRGPTHSLAAALVAGAAAWLIAPSSLSAGARSARMRGDHGARLRFAAAVAAAYATHTLTDWLSSDTTAPIGLMALWPLTDEYYVGPLHVFLPVSRRYWLAQAWLVNLRALIRELLILGPLLWVALWVSSDPNRRILRGGR